MKLHYYSIISLLVYILSSCGQPKKLKSTVLDDMDGLISLNPDSAVQILDSYAVSSKDSYNYNRYILYSIQIKDKLDLSIKNNLEIFDVYNYFEKIESDYAGLSAYYCGKVLLESLSYDKAFKYYNIAESYAVKKNDLDFQGSILYAKGEILLRQLLNDQAKTKFLEARIIFNQTGNYKSEMKSLNSLASTFLLESKYDSALYYYDKAYDLAEKYDDKEECAYTIKDKGLVYYSIGDFKTAIAFAKKAKGIDSVKIRMAKADLLLSNAFLRLNRMDSARYYAYNAIFNLEKDSSQDSRTRVSAYLLLSEIADSQKNYKEALDKYKLYIQSLEDNISNNQINATIEAERKYNLDVAENKISELLVKQINTERIVILLLIILLFITVVYLRLYVKKNKALSKASVEIVNLTDSLSEFDKTKETISDYNNRYFNILKRAASLEYFIQNSGNKHWKILNNKFNEIAYGQENIDWNVLYKIMNGLNGNKFDQIKEKYAQLDETEFKICCLLCSKMNSNEISAIIQLKVPTIHMKTTNIRKKLGIEKYGNIAEFLFENLD